MGTEVTSRGPGHIEGVQEASHWAWEDSRPTVAQRAFLKEQAAIHIPDAEKRRAFITWVGARGTTRGKVERICKVWGVQLP